MVCRARRGRPVTEARSSTDPFCFMKSGELSLDLAGADTVTERARRIRHSQPWALSECGMRGLGAQESSTMTDTGGEKYNPRSELSS